ncbi:MAG: tyrosine-type recombinase/integrase [Candidatus Limnocylindrales bacterium]
MENQGYSRRYVARFTREIRRILTRAESAAWSCYADVYEDYTHTSQSAQYLRDQRTIIGGIEQFDVYHRFPDGRRRHALFPRGAYPLLSSEFQAMIDHYGDVAQHQGKKPTTIATESGHAATFFLALQQQGLDHLADVTEAAVLAVFLSPDGTPRRSASYKKSIMAVLKTGLPSPGDPCSRMLAFLPALRETRKNIPYLSQEEIAKVKAVLAPEDPSLTLRDKAIGMLALYTGVRSSDIAGLTLEAVDWGRAVITVRQQKTAVPLELPLTTGVGNALVDFLSSERPAVDSPHLFLSQRRPYERLASKSLGNVAVRIMRAAGIRQAPGDRQGLHLFRHHLATALLGHGVPQPVISRTLGHTSPRSLEPYLSADFPHLKAGALSIASWPVPREVFADA